MFMTIQGTEGNPIIFGTKNTDADTLADNSAQYDTFALTNTQSRAKPPKLHLTLEWCEFYVIRRMIKKLVVYVPAQLPVPDD